VDRNVEVWILDVEERTVCCFDLVERTMFAILHVSREKLLELGKLLYVHIILSLHSENNVLKKRMTTET